MLQILLKLGSAELKYVHYVFLTVGTSNKGHWQAIYWKIGADASVNI